MQLQGPVEFGNGPRANKTLLLPQPLLLLFSCFSTRRKQQSTFTFSRLLSKMVVQGFEVGGVPSTQTVGVQFLTQRPLSPLKPHCSNFLGEHSRPDPSKPEGHAASLCINKWGTVLLSQKLVPSEARKHPEKAVYLDFTNECTFSLDKLIQTVERYPFTLHLGIVLKNVSYGRLSFMEENISEAQTRLLEEIVRVDPFDLVIANDPSASHLGRLIRLAESHLQHPHEHFIRRVPCGSQPSVTRLRRRN